MSASRPRSNTAAVKGGEKTEIKNDSVGQLTVGRMLTNFVLPFGIFCVTSRFVALETALPTAEVLNTALLKGEKLKFSNEDCKLIIILTRQQIQSCSTRGMSPCRPSLGRLYCMVARLRSLKTRTPYKRGEEQCQCRRRRHARLLAKGHGTFEARFRFFFLCGGVHVVMRLRRLPASPATNI